MEYQHLLWDVDDRVARITLNRPERRNALAPRTLGELCHALRRARDDGQVGAVVLTGAGKVFCAGGDLSQIGGGDGPTASFAELNLALTEVGKPVIAMVHGHCTAGGIALVTGAHLALAAADAEFGTPEIDRGLWPMMVMASLFRCVPRKRGLELCLTGERIGADEAARIGLINRAVPAERLDDETFALARKLAAKSPAILRLGLDAFHRAEDLEYREALEFLQRQLFSVLATEDAREGLLAFAEKRAPAWKGR